jgi:hypothetical protein
MSRRDQDIGYSVTPYKDPSSALPGKNRKIAKSEKASVPTKGSHFAFGLLRTLAGLPRKVRLREVNRATCGKLRERMFTIGNDIPEFATFRSSFLHDRKETNRNWTLLR